MAETLTSSSPAERLVHFAEHDLNLRLRPGQRELLTSFETSGAVRAVWCCGRRSGKSLLSDICALYDCLVRTDLRRYLRPGEPRIAAIISPTLEQSALHIRSCADLLTGASERLQAWVSDIRGESIRFDNGSEIRAYPCSARSLRGMPFSVLVMDEQAHFNQATGSNSADRQVWEAAVPATAQFGGRGWVICTSTPLHQEGTFYDLYRAAESGRTGTHFWHAATTDMNDRIDAAFLEEERERDPDLFRREYLAEWISGSSAYFDPADLDAVTVHARSTLPPQPQVSYAAAADPGYSADSWALSICHKERDGVIVVDLVKAWHRPSHEAVLSAVADLCRAYRIPRLVIDQHAAPVVAEGFRRHGILTDYRPWNQANKHDAFSRLKVAVTTRAIELPDDRNLRAELGNLESFPTPNGGVRIAARSTRHDDRATSLAAAVAQLSVPRMTKEEIAGLSDAMDDLRHDRITSVAERRDRASLADFGQVGGSGSGRWPF